MYSQCIPRTPTVHSTKRNGPDRRAFKSTTFSMPGTNKQVARNALVSFSFAGASLKSRRAMCTCVYMCI